MAKPPKISIITPSYNSGSYLQEAIKSIIDQHDPNYEHIIVDGGSTDQTLAIVKRYPQIRFITLESTHIEAINHGLEVSTGDIITVLNADDYFAPHAFSTVRCTMKKHPHANIILGDCNKVDKAGQLIYRSQPAVNFDQMLRPWLYEIPINPSSYFYKKAIHQDIGIYDSSYGIVFDYEFILRASQFTTPCYIPQVLGNFRFYPGTYTYDHWHEILPMNIGVSKDYAGTPASLSYYRYWTSLGWYQFKQATKLDNSYYYLQAHPIRQKLRLRTRIRNVFNQVHHA